MQSDSIDSIHCVSSVSADPFTQCFRLYLDPEASGLPSFSLLSSTKRRDSTHEQNSLPQSIISNSQLDLAAIGAENQDAPPELAGQSVEVIASVVEKHSSKQKLEFDSPKIRNHGQFQA